MMNSRILQNTFRAVSYSTFLQPEASFIRERIAVAGLAVLLHLSVFAFYLLQPVAPAVQVSEMSISFASMQMQQADGVPQPKAVLRKPDPLPSEKAAMEEEVQPDTHAATPASSVVLDAEPDYKAEYLNNPRPAYPMIARRMGYHGKVVLEVEVLAEGKAGEVKLLQSSGFELLDSSAMQTVKTWRFIPARRFGQAVTQRFLVPIKFSLNGGVA